MFSRVLDKFREGENKLIISVFGVITLSGLAYLAYRSVKRTFEGSHIQTPSEIDEKQGEGSKQQPRLKPANEELTKNLIRIVNNIKASVKNTQDFAFEAVKAIYEGFHQLSIQQFQKLAIKSRILRRQSFKDLEKYKNILMDHQNQIQTSRTHSLIAILQFFKLELREWMVLIDKYSIENKEQWEQIVILTDVKQLNSLRNPQKQSILPEKLVEIFQFKLSVFDEVLAAAGKVYQQRSDPQLFSFVDRRLSDMVYFQFNIQDEDIFFSMVVIGPDTKARIQDLQQKINAKLEFFISGADKM